MCYLCLRQPICKIPFQCIKDNIYSKKREYIYISYADPTGMLLNIIGLALGQVFSGNKIETWKVYGPGWRADKYECCHVSPK